MSESPTPRRWFKWSWLTFSLRTMLVVVTVFACWLGWELKFIRERKAWMRDCNVPDAQVHKRDSSKGHIPWWRIAMGDEAIHTFVFFTGVRDEVCDHTSDLFPEARIVIRGWKTSVAYHRLRDAN